MKKTFVFAIALVMVLGFAGIAFAGVSGSAHDLQSGSNMADTPYALGVGTTQICVFCHHPHRGANTSGDANVKNTLLWNMADFSATSYATYSQSGTINATDPGIALNGTNAAQSFLCMACHDGTIGVGALVTSPGDVPTNNITAAYNLQAGANLGTTLADDHPVNITYPTAGLGDILANVGDWVNGQYPLFTGKMQCGTCHDVHAGGVDSQSADISFMRGDIVGSQICLDCHTGK